MPLQADVDALISLAPALAHLEAPERGAAQWSRLPGRAHRNGHLAAGRRRRQVVAEVDPYATVRFLRRSSRVGRLTRFAVCCLVASLPSFSGFARLSLVVNRLPW
jgi:hypothetical protein